MSPYSTVVVPGLDFELVRDTQPSITTVCTTRQAYTSELACAHLGRFKKRVDGPVLICRRSEPERSSIDVLFLLS
jgi:hypothetical protein